MSLLEILASVAVLALVVLVTLQARQRGAALPQWQESLALRRVEAHEEAWSLVLSEARHLGGEQGPQWTQRVDERLDALAFMLGPGALTALLAYRRAAYARADLPLSEHIDVRTLADVAEMAADMFKVADRVVTREEEIDTEADSERKKAPPTSASVADAVAPVGPTAPQRSESLFIID